MCAVNQVCVLPLFCLLLYRIPAACLGPCTVITPGFNQGLLDPRESLHMSRMPSLTVKVQCIWTPQLLLGMTET